MLLYSVICQFHHLFVIVCDDTDEIAALNLFSLCIYTFTSWNNMYAYWLGMCSCLLICESQIEPSLLLRNVADWLDNCSFLDSVVNLEKSVPVELKKEVWICTKVLDELKCIFFNMMVWYCYRCIEPLFSYVFVNVLVERRNIVRVVFVKHVNTAFSSCKICCIEFCLMYVNVNFFE